jgi:PAS domain S-box-containing protein
VSSGRESSGPGTADGLDEEDYRRAVRARFDDIEIDLLLEIVSRVPVAIWAASGEGAGFAVRLWSPGAERLYGFSREEILGANYIERFVNRLERRQAILDHRRTEATRFPYRNLARDQQSDGTTRLMLTQGIAVWHPVLKEYLQGEVTVDATDVPGKDRSWLEQVLTPEAIRSLLEHFSEMSQAAFVSVERVTEVAAGLIRVFLGETAECVVFAERPGAQLDLLSRSGITACEFDPKAVVRWLMRSGQPALVVDYAERLPPRRTRTPHTDRFPLPLTRRTEKAPFAVGAIRNEAGQSIGGVFVSLAPKSTFSELTDGMLAAVSGAVRLALAIEEKIAQTKREGSLAAKERERQATTRLARQYRHAVLKKADLLEFHAGLLQEEPDASRIERIAKALRAMAHNLRETGKSFETNLSMEAFNLGDVLSSVTGAIMEAYPGIVVMRDDFPEVQMDGVRPFIEGAFENLLLNAVEAQDYQGRIGVFCPRIERVGRLGRFVNVLVCDDGPGLPGDVRQMVIAGQPISTKGTERGLGLVIARLSFHDCDGTLEPLEKPLAGWSGACFRVRLPVRSARRR